MIINFEKILLQCKTIGPSKGRIFCEWVYKTRSNSYLPQSPYVPIGNWTPCTLLFRIVVNCQYLFCSGSKNRKIL